MLVLSVELLKVTFDDPFACRFTGKLLFAVVLVERVEFVSVNCELLLRLIESWLTFVCGNDRLPPVTEKAAVLLRLRLPLMLRVPPVIVKVADPERFTSPLMVQSLLRLRVPDDAV